MEVLNGKGVRRISIMDHRSLERMLQTLSQAVVTRDCKTVKELMERMLDERVDPFVILNRGLNPGMLSACEQFRKGTFHIPELLMSSRALKIGMNILRPLIRDRERSVLGRVVIGTVKFDLHDIGKNLVNIVLEGNGFEVIDLGVDISPEKFVRAVEKYEPHILAMSSLLTSTMGWMKSTLELLGEAGMKGTVRTIIGGAPVTPIFAHNIGADGYCAEATSAAETVKKLMGIEA